MPQLRLSKVFKVVLVLAIVYLGLYSFDSVCGGYLMRLETDPAERYQVGEYSFAARRTAVLWQPWIGYSSHDHSDLAGFVFYPLIWIDRKVWHKTMYATDPEVQNEIDNLSPLRVHPESRREFLEQQRRIQLPKKHP